ncbi:MAG: serine hydrolase domain-containing protein, partial [Desulfobacterales bacterium]
MNVLISAIRRPRRDISLVEKRGCQVLLAILSIILSDPLAAASLPISNNEAPVAVSADFADFCWIDDLVEEAIRQQRLPGAVILVGQYDRILYRKAFGHRSLVPDPESMTIDTVFDLASLTKVVATTTSIMQLVDSGRISLEDPVTRYIPEFKRHGKSGITVQHLLTHMSGLRPGINPARPWHGYRDAIEQITDDVPRTPPGENIVYSDVNFILLGEIVRRVSGMSLDQFAHEHLFEPLGMQDTMYHPPEKIRARIAPTERCWKGARPCGGPDGTMLRGLVHDPSARRMGGSPGHAGLFSTVDDLSIFCRMLLGDGLFGQTRLLSPATILAMISPSTPLDKGHLRALGWSLDTTCHDGNKKASPMPIDHSGFTGTKLWLHPATGL